MVVEAASAMCTSRAAAIRCYQPLSSMETCKGFNSTVSFTSSPSTLLLSLKSRARNRNGSLICKAREAVDGVEAVTESNWNTEVIGNKSPVLVEFWAPWCGPCRMIAPVIVELAKQYEGKIDCYTVNTDECPNIATQYGIRSIPTVLFFKNGEKKESVIGAVPKSTLSATIEKYIEI